jgi:hypothetical protein
LFQKTYVSMILGSFRTWLCYQSLVFEIWEDISGIDPEGAETRYCCLGIECFLARTHIPKLQRNQCVNQQFMQLSYLCMRLVSFHPFFIFSSLFIWFSWEELTDQRRWFWFHGCIYLAVRDGSKSAERTFWHDNKCWTLMKCSWFNPD